jgi:uncharacterized protein YndB with AHSA1/START domain
MFRRMIGAGVLALSLGGNASGEVKASAADGMTIQIVAEIALDRDDAWARLVDVRTWWAGSHTYSGAAGNLSLNAEAGGCWCEAWDGGEVEHGRVVMVMPKNVLRIDGAFGPLQEMGVGGAMTFTLSDGAGAGRTKITLDYKVTGSSLSGLGQLAPIVDQVLAEQVTRYASAT